MVIKVILILVVIFLFNLGSAVESYAKPYNNIFTNNWTALNFESIENWANGIQIKGGEPYDEKKDPALRKGTENWEEPQGSFFVIPAVVVGLIVIVLFFNRK
jgi:hypothetical protein